MKTKVLMTSSEKWAISVIVYKMVLNQRIGSRFGQLESVVKEIRIHEESGSFRVMYIATFSDAIYVLHSFQKKSQKTSNKDINIAKIRYKAITQKQ